MRVKWRLLKRSEGANRIRGIFRLLKRQGINGLYSLWQLKLWLSKAYSLTINVFQKETAIREKRTLLLLIIQQKKIDFISQKINKYYNWISCEMIDPQGALFASPRLASVHFHKIDQNNKFDLKPLETGGVFNMLFHIFLTYGNEQLDVL